MSGGERSFLSSGMQAGRLRNQVGFTLIELLVVIAILGILISLLMPSLNQAREQARRVGCVGNLRQQFVALTLYANDSRDGRFPKNPHEFNGDGSTTWRYLYQYDVRQRSSFSLLDKLGYLNSPKILYCPSNGGFGSPAHSWPNDAAVYPDRDPSRTLAGGMYWGNYAALFVNQAADWRVTNDNILGTRQVASIHNSQAIFSVDVTPGGSNIYGSRYLGNHLVNGLMTGVNVGITDGSARWYAIDRFTTMNTIEHRPTNAKMQPYRF